MSRISLTLDARQDLTEIYDFIANDNATAAEKQIRRLQERWRVLVIKPRIGTNRSNIYPDLRSLTEGNCVIFYRIIPNEIQIVRILHAAQDAKRAFHE